MNFERLVRYEAEGSVHFGELFESNDGGYKVKRLDDSLESDVIESVTKVCPLSRCHRDWQANGDACI